ncbi:hypothetical protein C8Q80DRAFT_1214420 [Daedaleopsis nitida]|nr:hypothetical protein C8Q80DRAFT_1214420 [Daedaleopsis nitida]
MNVMLTRCKAGLVIVTQRAFLHNTAGGKRTLLGKLAEHWEDRVGASVAWADAMDVAGERASLPGVPGRNAHLGTGRADVDGLALRMSAIALGWTVSGM